MDDARTTITTVPVRSTDVDSDGHVNNARYYEYCEQGRLAHLARIGVISTERRRVPYHGLFTIVETGCRYHRPAYYGDLLDVHAQTVHVGRSSFRLRYEIRRDGELIAEGESVQVWLGEDGRSAPLPAEIRQRLLETLAEPAAEAP